MVGCQSETTRKISTYVNCCRRGVSGNTVETLFVLTGLGSVCQLSLKELWAYLLLLKWAKIIANRKREKS